MTANKKDELLRIFPARLRPVLKQACWELEHLEEIRIRVGQPIIFSYGMGERYVSTQAPYLTGQEDGVYRVSPADAKEMLNYMCSFSLYAFARELQQGFLTLPGGNRVGVCGELAEAEAGAQAMEYPCFFNIRIAHERRGCAEAYLPYIRSGTNIYHTLILSAPGVGKTTFLRDCIRLLGQPPSPVRSIGLVDERFEIAASVHGVPQNDVGMRCDVLSGCKKRQGMEIMLRTMGPAVIAVDEIGGRDEEEILRRMIYSGVGILATAHAGSVEELENQAQRSYLLEDMFQRFVILQKGADGQRKIQMLDEHRRRLC